jgi:hypothetical protein
MTPQCDSSDDDDAERKADLLAREAHFKKRHSGLMEGNILNEHPGSRMLLMPHFFATTFRATRLGKAETSM